MPTTIHGTNGITFNDGSTQNTRPAVGFRNRIINGDMRIDQRNAGAAITTQGHPVDRFALSWAMDGAVSCQRSTTAPSGYRNSLAISVTAQDASIGASQSFQVLQKIEGNNISDLMLGTGNAGTMTLSFWVNSSKTGVYCCTFANGAATRLLPVQYTINNANTWEQKTIAISGDTSGTWLSDNGLGLYVIWNLALGSNYNAGSNNTWNTTQYGTANQVNFLDTNGATFYITGVQLEAGSTATDFERRPIGTELALCQRYYSKSYEDETAPGSATTLGLVFAGKLSASSYGYCSVNYDVKMRGVPTINFWDGNGNASKFSYLTESAATTTFTHNIAPGSSPFNISSRSFCIVASAAIVNSSFLHFQASAEL